MGVGAPRRKQTFRLRGKEEKSRSEDEEKGKKARMKQYNSNEGCTTPPHAIGTFKSGVANR